MTTPDDIHPVRRWTVLAFDLVGLAILFVMAVAGGALLAIILFSIFTPENWVIVGAFAVLGLLYGVMYAIGMGLLKGADRVIGRPFHRLGRKIEAWSTVTPTGPRIQRLARWFLLTGFLTGGIGIPLLGYVRTTFNI